MTRPRAIPGSVLAVLALVGCAGGQPASASPAPPELVAALDGEAILQRTCTRCHTLRGLSAYASYWGEAEWRSMVETMIGYGAQLTPEELPVLVKYLADHY